MRGNIYDNLGIEPEEQEPEQIIPASVVHSTQNNTNNVTADPEISEIAISVEQIQLAAQQDLDFFAALAMPGVFRYKFPPVYIAVWQWLTNYAHKQRDFSQLALGLPRGFAKTGLLKLFYLYCILFTQKKFLIILCENQTKAVAFVSDVIDMLSEPNIVRSFGDWRVGIEKDTQDQKKFGYRGRNIVFMAGTVETIRGLSLKNERPDLMGFDDIQNRTMAESQQVSEALEREMYGTAMKAKSPHGCLFVFVANMYPTKWSILRKLKHNPNWIKFIAGGILEDGTSLWEELQPIAQLHREFLNDLSMGHPEIFYSEVLNDENASVNSNIDISKIPVYPFQNEDIPGGRFIIIDPSNDKANSDAVSIGYFEVHNGYPVLRKLTEGRMSPGDMIRCALTYCFTYGASLIAIEANAYQYSLLYWFRFICEQMNVVGIQAVDIYSGTLSKNSRILSMFKQLLKGEVWIHPDCQAAAHLQISQFNALKRDNTDGILDLLTYATKVMQDYEGQIVESNIIDSQEYNALEVIEHNSPF